MLNFCLSQSSFYILICTLQLQRSKAFAQDWLTDRFIKAGRLKSCACLTHKVKQVEISSAGFQGMTSLVKIGWKDIIKISRPLHFTTFVFFYFWDFLLLRWVHSGKLQKPKSKPILHCIEYLVPLKVAIIQPSLLTSSVFLCIQTHLPYDETNQPTILCSAVLTKYQCLIMYLLYSSQSL